MVYWLLKLLFCALKDWVQVGISALLLCGDGNVVYKIKSDDPFSLCMCLVAWPWNVHGYRKLKVKAASGKKSANWTNRDDENLLDTS